MVSKPHRRGRFFEFWSNDTMRTDIDMNDARIVALVPMRDQSERVPGKNYRLFAGRPLYHVIVEVLLGCPQIAEVVIDTDSPTIKDDASRHFERVRLLDRPEHLRGGEVPMNDVLLHDVREVEADFFLQTHSTNPLLRSETVSAAIERFLASTQTYDSLFSVTRLQTRLWDPLARAVNHNAAILLRTQDLPPIYEENSCIYLFGRGTLENRHNRIGERPLMHEIPAEEALDIDEEWHFRVAELMYRSRERITV
jgi:CMP-N-acetylneuraminic acid synthetase